MGDHPGEGLILPIDAHPKFDHWGDGTLMRPRIASYDSTFGLEPTDAITLQVVKAAGETLRHVTSQQAVTVFDDTRTYWFDADEHAATGAHLGRYKPGWYSVDPPNTGTTMQGAQRQRRRYVRPGFRRSDALLTGR